MILVKLELEKNIQNKKIFYRSNGDTPLKIGPNSIDVSLFDTLVTYTDLAGINVDNYQSYRNVMLDAAKDNSVFHTTIPDDGIILYPGILYLGSTNEAVGSDFFVPMYEGRSSMARLGIQTHISAGFGDVGFKSNWTLEITATHPTKIYKNMRIGQVYFHKISKKQQNKLLNNKAALYDGKYTNQQIPLASKSYMDFDTNSVTQG